MKFISNSYFSKKNISFSEVEPFSLENEEISRPYKMLSYVKEAEKIKLQGKRASLTSLDK